MGKEFIGPAIEHFQEITAQYPEVRTRNMSGRHFRENMRRSEVVLLLWSHNTMKLVHACRCNQAPFQLSTKIPTNKYLSYTQPKH